MVNKDVKYNDALCFVSLNTIHRYLNKFGYAEDYNIVFQKEYGILNHNLFKHYNIDFS